MNKRVWKLQDFVAHSGDVLCARLGEKSGQVLATGGDDKRVNIWKVGKPNAMMSLTGHSTSVECLVFDKHEEVLVVGCGGGSMQVWNLEYQKMAGTLAGHRAACTSVEFHPYGEFFASGSADTNLKVWDLRRKSCIQTYKGHTGMIDSIRFSPHGRWVATGARDGKVKIWDLTAGKIMQTLAVHKGPITTVAFHPKEYLLATGSTDRTMQLWSLETFQVVGSSELYSSPVQVVKFYVEEQAVLSASQDSLRLYPLDGFAGPVPPQDTIEVDWRGLQDMRLCFPEEKLIAITAERSQLGIWVADLQKHETGISKCGGVNGYGRLHTASRPPAGGAAAHHQGQGQRQVSRHPPAEEPDAGDPLGPEFSDYLAEPEPEHDQTVHGGIGSGLGRGHVPSSSSDRTVRPSAAERMPTRAESSPMAARGRAMPGDLPEQSGERIAAVAEPQLSAAAAAAAAVRGREQGVEPPVDDGPCPAGPVPIHRPKRSVTEDFDATPALMGQHLQMMGVLQRRLNQVRRLKELWAVGNMAGLTNILNMPQDHAVFCDLARVIMQPHHDGALSLDACQTLLPILVDLLRSKYEDFVSVSLQFAQVLLAKFGDLITDTRRSCSGMLERQMDFAREERLEKCNACYEHFKEMRRLLPDSSDGKLSRSVRSSLQRFLRHC